MCPLFNLPAKILDTLLALNFSHLVEKSKLSVSS